MTATMEGPRTAGRRLRSPGAATPAQRDSGAAPGAQSLAGGGDAELVAALGSMPTGFLALDRDWRIVELNAAGERTLDITRAALLGRVLWEAFPATAGTVFEENYRQAVASGQPVSFNAYYPAPLTAWYEIVAHPHAGGLWLFFVDISAHRLAERVQLLAATSEALVDTTDAETGATRLAHLLVPALADWCIVTLVTDNGGLRDVGMAHRDATRLEDVRAYAAVQIEQMTEQAPIWQVLQTGLPFHAPRIRPEAVEVIFPDPRARALLARLAPTSGTAVPLTARGRTLGVIGLWNTGARPVHTAEEIETALDIARRIALAIDNLELLARQRNVSGTLQRSLLTEPLQSEDLSIAVRYRPAADDLQVGGDWYDSFRSAGGDTCVVIGDVSGHDQHAAATMGQVRNMVRTLAFHLPGSPAEVLASVDAAMLSLTAGAIATATLAVVCRAPAGEFEGTHRLRWSNAGHPPPLLIHPDGTAQFLATDPDLLLGMDAGAERRAHEFLLPAGCTVLLYTDGLVERRDASLDDGLDWLLRTAAPLGGLPLDELCDRLLALTAADSEDDIALLALRPLA